jgi:hypothetical protein
MLRTSSSAVALSSESRETKSIISKFGSRSCFYFSIALQKFYDLIISLSGSPNTSSPLARTSKRKQKPTDHALPKMAPIKPFWTQPSHPEIQEVIYGEDENGFTTESISKISLPSFGLFAKLVFILLHLLSATSCDRPDTTDQHSQEFPPCTIVEKPSYSTVQIGKDKHMDLNSDLLYLNHSCEPSLVCLVHFSRSQFFNSSSSHIFIWTFPPPLFPSLIPLTFLSLSSPHPTPHLSPTPLTTPTSNQILNPRTLTLTATSRGLSPKQPLTFFYPSTEWLLSQPFRCNCGTPSCLGTITGAGDAAPEIIAQLKDRELGEQGFGKGAFFSAHILEMLEEREREYGAHNGNGKMNGHANGHPNGHLNGEIERAGAGEDVGAKTAARRGVTSREMSGEMGGDTL